MTSFGFGASAVGFGASTWVASAVFDSTCAGCGEEDQEEDKLGTLRLRTRLTGVA